MTFAKRSMILAGVAVLLAARVAQGDITVPVRIALESVVGDSRLGISLNIGGAAWTESYLFDTGSNFLMSGWAPGAQWWGTASVDTGDPQSAIYGPGSGQNKLDYYPATASVTLTDNTHSVTAPALSLNQVYGGETNADPNVFPANWQPNTVFNTALQNAVTTGDPPFASIAGPFFGIFGADLSSSTTGLYGVISQLDFGTGISKGFTVRGDPSAAAVTIGLSGDDIARFDTTFAMNTLSGQFEETIISPDYEVFLDGVGSLTLDDIPTILDTGTPPEVGVFLMQGTGLDVSAYTQDGQLLDGTTFTLMIGGTPYTIISTTANPIYVFDAPPGDAGAAIYGLNFFQDFEVMYDIDSGLLGVTAIPEPGTIVLFALGGITLLAFRKRPSKIPGLQAAWP